jgi:predicted dehydrogenase
LVVGGGSIGERHLRCFQQIGADARLCDTNDARRQEVSDRYGLPESFASVEAAAERTWDAAVICTPAHLHVGHAVTLAPRTKGLLIEKPLATNLAEVPRLREAIAGKTVGVAYVLRTHPAVEAVKEVVAAGRLGKLLQVTVLSGQHFPTFRPAYREIYYNNRATGGGAIQDAATHSFDLIQYLAGRFDWIYCDASHQALPGVEVEDTVHVVGRTNGGKVMVSLALNQFMAPNETIVALNGNEASAQIRFHESCYGVLRLGEQEWKWSEPLVKERDDLFRMQAQRFLDALAGHRSVACSLDDAQHALFVNLAALKSMELKKVISIQQAVGSCGIPTFDFL